MSKKYFHTFDHICANDIQLTNTRNHETNNLTISDKSMGLYELNEKLKIARQRGFSFNQIVKLTTKIVCNLSNINICYYLKLPIPMCHRQFLKNLTENLDFVKTHFNDRNNSFQFAIRK